MKRDQMSIKSARLVVSSVLAFTASLLLLAVLSQPAHAARTVTITGNAYAFIFAGNKDRLEGARIGIAEMPGLTTTAGPNGAYALEVPDDTTITPYAEFEGYYPTHHQTFHTSGEDLRQVNFQMPALTTYNLLAGYVQAGLNQDGSLTDCGIVSTFFQKEGRSFNDFDDFHDFRPHGVEGSTAVATPAAGRQFYFNHRVLPDPEQPSSSRDGGVLWVDVESGVYEIKGSSDTTRHASFVATCEPGRLVNANPPWGLVELAGNEAINPAVLPDTKLNAHLLASRVVRKNGKRRILNLRFLTTESATAAVRLRQVRTSRRNRQVKRQVRKTITLQAGRSDATIAVPSGFKGGRASLQVVLTDTAGNSRTASSGMMVPHPRR
jgi:hypothetical protein